MPNSETTRSVSVEELLALSAEADFIARWLDDDPDTERVGFDSILDRTRRLAERLKELAQ